MKLESPEIKSHSILDASEVLATNYLTCSFFSTDTGDTNLLCYVKYLHSSKAIVSSGAPELLISKM